MVLTALRPLRAGEILDAGIKIVRRHLGVFFRIVLPVQLALDVIFIPLLILVLPDETEIITDRDSIRLGLAREEIGGFIGLGALQVVVSGVVAIVLLGACVRASGRAYLGEPASATDGLGMAARRLPTLFVLAVVCALTLALGFIMCFVGSLAAMTLISVAFPVFMIEGAGPFKAFGRSSNLAGRRFWPVLGTVALAFLLFVLVSGAGAGVRELATGDDPTTATVVTTLLIGSLMSLILSPFTYGFLAAVMTVLYYDLRVRVEGYDLELLSAAATEAPSPGSAGEPILTPRPAATRPLAPAAAPSPLPPPPWRQSER